MCAALWWVVFSGAAWQLHPATVQTQSTVGIHFKQTSPRVPRKVNRGVPSLFILFPNIKMCRNVVFEKAGRAAPTGALVHDRTKLHLGFDTTLGFNQVIWIRLKARFRANNTKGQGNERSFQPLFQIPSNRHVGAKFTFPAMRFRAADLPRLNLHIDT